MVFVVTSSPSQRRGRRRRWILLIHPGRCCALPRRDGDAFQHHEGGPRAAVRRQPRRPLPPHLPAPAGGLVAAGTPASPSRVVNVSSIVHIMFTKSKDPIDWDNLEPRAATYRQWWNRYGASLLFLREQPAHSLPPRPPLMTHDGGG